jgi:hypothetical protein
MKSESSKQGNVDIFLNGQYLGIGTASVTQDLGHINPDEPPKPVPHFSDPRLKLNIEMTNYWFVPQMPGESGGSGGTVWEPQPGDCVRVTEGELKGKFGVVLSGLFPRTHPAHKETVEAYPDWRWIWIPEVGPWTSMVHKRRLAPA